MWSVGKKAPPYFRYRGIEVAQSFAGFADRPEFADARAHRRRGGGALRRRRDRPGGDGVDPLHLGRHPARRAPADAARSRCPRRTARRRAGRGSPLEGYTEFEPEPEKLLVELAPRARSRRRSSPPCSKGRPSFFTAQQRAMAAATENADELVRTLTRVMNRARQDAITTEIMEIVGGAEALRQSKGA